MIYLLGASHIQPILNACAAPGPLSMPKFSRDEPPAFRECLLQEGMLPDRLKVASIYMGHIAPFWGAKLAAVTPQGVLGVAPGFQALLEVAETDPECRHLFVAMRGEEYYQVALGGVAEPFDFILPARPELAIVPGHAVLSLEVVQHQLAQRLAQTYMALAAIRKLCPRLHVIHITPPPPASSEDVAAWALAHGHGDVSHKVPTTVRLKLWLLYTRLLASFAASIGVECLPVPAQAVHGLGTLRPEYMGDFIHGNARYGVLVCNQMAAAVSQSMEGAH